MSEETLKNKAVKGVFWTFFERILAQGVSTVVSIVLARILMPEDYSVISIVAIFFSFCNIFISSGLSSALVQKKEADALDFSSVLFVNLGISAVLYLAIFFCAPLVADLYSMPILIPIMRVMGLSFFIYLLKSVASAYISRTMQFKKYFFATIVGTIVSAVIGIYMANNGFGPWALVAQQMSNALIDTIILFATSGVHFVFKCSWKRLKPMIGYSSRLFGGSLIANTFIEVKPLIVGLKYTATDLALYTKAENYPRLVSTTIESTLTSVLVPVIKEVQDNYEKVRNIARRFFRLASYLLFPAMLGFGAVSEGFVRVVLTEKWMGIVPYLPIFCFAYMLEFITLGTRQTLKAIGRADIVLKLEIVKNSLAASLIFLFVFLAQTPLVFAYSTVAISIATVIVELIIMSKIIGYRFRMLFNDLGGNLIISVIMAILVYMLGLLDWNIYLLLFVQVLAGCIIYLLLSIITGNESFHYFYSLLKSFIKKKKQKGNWYE